MSISERLQSWKIHPSMRGRFAYEFYKLMASNLKIYLLTGDLGYGMFDAFKEDFPERFINVGASEQSMLDIAVGLSYEGKIPFCYSITPFLIYRGFETIRTYIDHEKLNVKLIGGGRDNDYRHDGFSHHAFDVKDILYPLENVKQLYPTESNQVEGLLEVMVYEQGPYFISIKR